MTERKKICFAATNKTTCEFVGQQLNTLLGHFATIGTWCLSEAPAEVPDCDIFLAGNPAVHQYICDIIPVGKKIMLANRTLEIKNLDEILTLAPNTEVLMVSNFEATAYETIALFKNFAINNIRLHPYWPGKTSYPTHVKVAVTTGYHPAPPGIERVIDLGPRTLDLSTFVELIVELDLPRNVINDISGYYISTIVSMAARRLSIAEQNQKLKERLEVVLDTVDQGIIAVDQDEKICLFNPAAEAMLGQSDAEVLGKRFKDILPELETFVSVGTNLADSIRKIGHSYYVINITPVFDSFNNMSGSVVSLKAADEVQELDSKVRRELKQEGNVAKHYFKDIVSTSEGISGAVRMAKKFSNSDLTILLEGESGTGKELFAQSIHNASARKNAPFVAINFAALLESLVESELFGYQDGAFTGAKKGGKPGLFEVAHTGTIFLDEIGDATPEVQKRLLRVLEEKEVRRVGGNTLTPVDVRVIAATNRNLRQLMKEGAFRQDLYFRLCTIQIAIPPLRNRREDVPSLIAFFAHRLYRRELLLDSQVQDYLRHYGWPGNARELQNVVKFLCGMAGPSEVITMKHLPQYLFEVPSTAVPAAAPADTAVETALAEFAGLGPLEPLRQVLAELKKAEKYERPAGRNSIAKALAGQAASCSEHKVRLWLKRLEQGGCVVTNTTKQGSRLTRLGEDVLSYLQDSAR
ncbi:MAG: sigma 54-interacting transcriptional regulator [Negativicutes bacterium]|nr:sigma 54-interacting transcriptional regulator [Negativicutes bacterium]